MIKNPKFAQFEIHEPIEKLELAMLLMHWQWLDTCYEGDDDRDYQPTIESSVADLRISGTGYGISEKVINAATNLVNTLDLSSENAFFLAKQLLEEIS